MGASVVVPSWNGAGLLREFLPSLRAAAEDYSSSAGRPVEIIVADDGSTDDSIEYLSSQGFAPHGSRAPGSERLLLAYCRHETNLGFNATANLGVRAAAQPLILLLNNDVQPPREALGALARRFADPRVFAVHGNTVDADTGRLLGAGQLLGFARGFLRVHQGYEFEAGAEETGPLWSAFASGGAAMYRRELLLALGAFDPLLSPAYWEDVELSYRAWKRGYVVLYEPSVTFRHRVSSTMRRLSRSGLERLQQRNRLLYHWVHLHDAGMMTAHLGWTGLLALTAPLRMRPGFLAAFGAALARLREVRRRRRQERQLAARTDRELVDLFDAFSRRPGIVRRTARKN